MQLMSEKALRRIVKDEVTRYIGTAPERELVDELAAYLGQARGSRTQIEAAIIRTIDKYHGISESSLQTGRAIYLAVWHDED